MKRMFLFAAAISTFVIFLSRMIGNRMHRTVWRTEGDRPSPPRHCASCGIASGPVSQGIDRLRMSHPPLDERVAALRAPSVA